MVVDKYVGRCLDVGSIPTGSIFIYANDKPLSFFVSLKIYQAMISCERFLNFLLTGGVLFRIMDTSLEDYSRGLRGRVGNAVGV